MTKKEKLIQKINDLLPNGEVVDETLTTKELEKKLYDLEYPSVLPPKTPETITRAEHKAKIVGLMRIMTGTDNAAKEKAQAEINELNRMVYEKRVV